MPIYRDTQHLYRVLDALFDRVRSSPEIASRLREGNLVVRFRYSEPEGVATIDLRPMPLSYKFGPSDLRPDVE
ncbi:MAG: hypothetical protein M8467_12220, partial [Anaerolineae bacterium]|nr:hypothetical protein [Anaerolineae bacterium]